MAAKLPRWSPHNQNSYHVISCTIWESSARSSHERECIISKEQKRNGANTVLFLQMIESTVIVILLMILTQYRCFGNGLTAIPLETDSLS